MPLISLSCRITYKRMLGRTAIDTVASVSDHWVPKRPENLSSARGKVCSVFLVRNTRASISSFHTPRKLKIVTEATAGRLMGTIMRKKSWKMLQPSMIAASSTLLGRERI